MITTDIISHSVSCVYCLLDEQTCIMKVLLVLCLFAAAALADDKYTDKYDNINLDEILENKRLLLAYVNCVMERGKCSPEGKELKEHLQDAIETGCSKCTEAQEKGAYKVIEHLIKNELDIWRELAAKYDPKGDWRKKYEDRARANGIQIPETTQPFFSILEDIFKYSRMKFLVVAIVVTLAAFAVAETYTDRYDNINIDEIIENRKLLVPYIKCVLEQGRCTPEGRELKAHIKDALQTSCTKCTQKQRKASRKVVKHIRANELDYWKQLLAKYDPDSIYVKNYESFLAADD
nr:uncharacterized protein LOC110376358 [Helicoverpa armigera]